MAPDQRSVLVRGVNRPNAARPPLVGTINREALLHRLAGADPVTVRDLARETSLSVPAVSRALADLVDAGLVINDGPVVGGLGRRPHGYRVNEHYCYSVAVDLGQVPAVLALGTLTCHIVAKVTVDLTGLTSVSDVLIREVRRLLADAHIPQDKLATVTVANPGVVDPDTGTMHHPADSATWPNDPIRLQLAQEFGLPVLVMNDVKMATIGELYQGAGRGVDDFAYLRLDVGVAIGIVQNGRLISGATNAAGEFGSIRLDGFGRYPEGRLEDWLAHPGPNGAVPEPGEDRLEALGDVVGIIAALLDPSVVLLGGKFSELLDDDALAAVRERAWRHCVSSPEVRRADHSLDAALVGGLSVAADHFLSTFAAGPQEPETRGSAD